MAKVTSKISNVASNVMGTFQVGVIMVEAYISMHVCIYCVYAWVPCVYM